MQKSQTEDNICLEYRNKVLEAYKNKVLEDEEAARMMNSRKVYLEKKIMDKKEHKKHNTCFVLLAIVFLFILTHSFRLAFRIYEILLPRGNTAAHFEQCYRLGR